MSFALAASYKNHTHTQTCTHVLASIHVPRHTVHMSLNSCCKLDACKSIILHRVIFTSVECLSRLLFKLTVHAFVSFPHMQMIYKSLYPAPCGVSGILLNSLICLFIILCWYHDSIMCLSPAAGLSSVRMCMYEKVWSGLELTSSLRVKRLTAGCEWTASY